MKKIIALALLISVAYSVICGADANTGNAANMGTVAQSFACAGFATPGVAETVCTVDYNTATQACIPTPCTALNSISTCVAQPSNGYCMWDASGAGACVTATCASGNCRACSIEAATGDTDGDLCKLKAVISGFGCWYDSTGMTAATKWPCNDGACGVVDTATPNQNCYACGTLSTVGYEKDAAYKRCRDIPNRGCHWKSDNTCVPAQCAAGTTGDCACATKALCDALSADCSWFINGTNTTCLTTAEAAT